MTVLWVLVGLAIAVVVYALALALLVKVQRARQVIRDMPLPGPSNVRVIPEQEERR